MKNYICKKKSSNQYFQYIIVCWVSYPCGKYQEVPPQKVLLGGPFWGGTSWVHQSSGGPTSTIMFCLIFQSVIWPLGVMGHVFQWSNMQQNVIFLQRGESKKEENSQKWIYGQKILVKLVSPSVTEWYLLHFVDRRNPFNTRIGWEVSHCAFYIFSISSLVPCSVIYCIPLFMTVTLAQ